MNTEEFQTLVYSHYDSTGKGMPWRINTKPYFIVVSELMLQQTQSSRVIPKFKSFIEAFPTFENLASADFRDVLEHWDGLGYNRRAKFIHRLAKEVIERFNGELPNTRGELESLPGIGPGTSGAILAYAFNKPAAYIETNIRAVYIHHFFADQDEVDDRDILRKVEQTLDTDNPRQWYWALMDYGVYLKSTLPNPSRRSKHHTKQSKFEGSDRQLRAQILKKLLSSPMTHTSLQKALSNDLRLERIIASLLKERMIVERNGVLSIADS